MRDILSLAIFFFYIARLQAGIYEPNVLWDKAEIKVCFLDRMDQIAETSYSLEEEMMEEQSFAPALFTQKDMNKIKRVVNKNYTKVDTGIHFVGWMPCSESNDYDAIVMKMKGIEVPGWFNDIRPPLGMSSIGQNGINVKGEGYLKKDFTTTPTVLFYSITEYTISHEFGHLAGMRHEHAHPESKNDDKTCVKEHRDSRNLRYYRDRRTEEKLAKTSVIFTDYDSGSIMNYCSKNIRSMTLSSIFSFTKHYVGHLTQSDKRTLKFIYYFKNL